MASQIFEVAILISLKDAASGKLDHVQDHLRSLGKEGKETLRTFEDLRKDLRQGLVLGGIGVAGLEAMRGGIKSAADYESAVTDLRASVATLGKDGAVNIAKLNDEMAQFEALGVKLGNTLPGSTKDFLELFTSLRQNGLQANIILDGAGERVAKLAVATHNVPAELGKEFAQLGEMFNFKGAEFGPATDLFAKLHGAVGLQPSQLIEGAKFAQLRGGLPLGFTGIKGATTMANLLGILRTTGLEGGIGGREMAGLIMGLSVNSKEQKKADAILKKKFGIDLKFFDHGEFAGEENMMKQFGKLSVLNPEQRLDLLRKRFKTQEAIGPASVFIDKGLEGYEKFQGRVKDAIDLESKVTMITETWNSRLQNVTGTLDNVKATAFTPLLNQLKPVLDATNNLLAELQTFGKEHQTLALIGTDIVGLGSVALIAVGGFKAMRAAWGLWKIASAIGSGEAGLLAFLKTTKVEAETTGVALESAGVKASGLKGKLGSIPATVKTAIVLVGIEYAIQKVSELYNAWKEYKQALGEQADAAKGAESSYDKLEKALAAQGKKPDQTIDKMAAISAFQSLNINDQLLKGLRGDLSIWFPFAGQRPFGTDYTGFNPKVAGRVFKERAPELAHLGPMKEFLRMIETMPQLTQEARAKIKETLEKDWPETFRTAKKELDGVEEGAKAAAPELSNLAPRAKETADSFGRLSPAVSDATQAMSLFAFKLGGFVPGQGGGAVGAPAKASGGTVISDGWAYVHAKEDIVPARVTASYNRRAQQSAPAHSGAGGVHIGSIHLHGVPQDSAVWNNPGRLAEMVADQLRRQRERD